MQIRGLRYLMVGIVLCLGVLGCSHKHQQDAYGAGAQGAGDGAAGFASDDVARDMMAKRKIYFDFDRSEIHQQDYEIIYAHAEYLKGSPNRRIRVEGHTDEEGSREYNIALGERRARAVAQALMSQGVSGNQIATVSFGKEKPDVLGHSGEDKALNRRAVIVYED